VIVTPRWTIILAALGYRIKASLLVGSVFLGFLFNQLLPTAVGGDVLRALQARQLGVAFGKAQPHKNHLIGTVQRAVSELNASIANLVYEPRALVAVLFLSILSQLFPVVAVGLLAAGLNVQISVLNLTFVSLCAVLAAAIPISFAGWGIREGALVFLFGLYGVPADTALAISILFGACLALASAPGALLLFGSRLGPTLGSVYNRSDH
jgi:uncharacterized membrane protein YbhN (UPF0104 family)